MKILLAVISCGILTIGGMYAQKPKETNSMTPKTLVYPTECGFRLREMVELVRKSDGDRALIVISHLGTGERDISHQRRLFNARSYLSSPFFDRPWKRGLIVLGRGESVVGLGYLDFFVDGELALRIQLERNADLYLGDCGGGEGACSNPFEEQFYPCQGKSKKH